MTTLAATGRDSRLADTAIRNSFLRHLRAKGLSPATITRYALSIRQYQEFAAAMNFPESPAREHVEHFLEDGRNRGHSDSSVRNDYLGLRAFFKWLFEEGEVTHDPMVNMTTPRVAEHLPCPYSDQEVRAMLRVCRGHTFEQVRGAAIIMTLFDTGLRAGEFVGLKISDVNLDSEHILVKGKGRKERIVRLGYRAQQAVDRYVRMRARKNASEQALWLNRNGRPLTVSGVFQLVQRICQQAGVPNPGLHRFRHTAATKMSDLGLAESDLMHLLGWSSHSMAARYTRTGARERALRAHRQFSPGDNLQV
jgi:site-specific recombinase XerD